LGFSPGEVAELLAAEEHEQDETIHLFFEKRRREIRSEVNRLQHIEAILQAHNASLEVLYMSLAEPVIKEVAPMRIMAKRGRGSYRKR
jgi:DNA-binding transcriptional MerR regulator